jgi:CrcB protein
MNYFWIFLGGGLGSLARFAASNLAARHVTETFPWSTIFVNVTGSLMIGFFAAATGPEGRWPVGLTARAFVMIGLCGGYTTFSAFSLQTLTMLREGQWGKACANSVLSFGLCLAAVWLGYLAAAQLNSGSSPG